MEILVHLAVYLVHHGKHTFQIVETRQDKVAGHDAKLPGHRMRQKEEPHAVFQQGPSAKFISTNTGLREPLNSPACGNDSNGKLIRNL